MISIPFERIKNMLASSAKHILTSIVGREMLAAVGGVVVGWMLTTSVNNHNENKHKKEAAANLLIEVRDDLKKSTPLYKEMCDDWQQGRQTPFDDITKLALSRSSIFAKLDSLYSLDDKTLATRLVTYYQSSSLTLQSIQDDWNAYNERFTYFDAKLKAGKLKRMVTIAKPKKSTKTNANQNSDYGDGGFDSASDFGKTGGSSETMSGTNGYYYGPVGDASLIVPSQLQVEYYLNEDEKAMWASYDTDAKMNEVRSYCFAVDRFIQQINKLQGQ